MYSGKFSRPGPVLHSTHIHVHTEAHTRTHTHIHIRLVFVVEVDALHAVSGESCSGIICRDTESSVGCSSRPIAVMYCAVLVAVMVFLSMWSNQLTQRWNITVSLMRMYMLLIMYGRISYWLSFTVKAKRDGRISLYCIVVYCHHDYQH